MAFSKGESLADILGEYEADDDVFEDEANTFDSDGKPFEENVQIPIDPQFASVIGFGISAVLDLLFSRMGVEPMKAEETQMIGDAAANVVSFYDVSADPKTAAWLGLGMVGGSILLPRVIAARSVTSGDDKPTESDGSAYSISEPTIIQPGAASKPFFNGGDQS